MDQADLYFAADILRLLNSHPAEFTSEKRLRISALLFSGNENFGEITFDPTKNHWEFASPIDESNFSIIEFGGKTMVSADEHKYIKNIVRTLNQSISPPVETYAKLETPRTFAFEILDNPTGAHIGSIFYNAKKSKYEFVVALNIIFAP